MWNEEEGRMGRDCRVVIQMVPLAGIENTQRGGVCLVSDIQSLRCLGHPQGVCGKQIWS